MRRLRIGIHVAAALLGALPCAPGAQGERNVRVVFEHQGVESSTRDAVGGGAAAIVERGTVRAGGAIEGTSRERRVRRSTGVFTLVRDGGDSTITLAARVPFRQIAFFRDYATGLGILASGVAFEDVGTALRVHADVLPERRIRLRLVPSVSYLSAGRAGVIDFAEAATELVVRDGEPVVIGGGTQRLNEVVREVLGISSETSEGESSMAVTATVE